MKKNINLTIPNWQKIIIEIRESLCKSKTKLSRKTGMCYTQLILILKTLEQKEIIISKKNGRSITIELSKKGESIADSIRKIIDNTK